MEGGKGVWNSKIAYDIDLVKWLSWQATVTQWDKRQTKLVLMIQRPTSEL